MDNPKDAQYNFKFTPQKGYVEAYFEDIVYVVQEEYPSTPRLKVIQEFERMTGRKRVMIFQCEKWASSAQTTFDFLIENFSDDFEIIVFNRDHIRILVIYDVNGIVKY